MERFAFLISFIVWFITTALSHLPISPCNFGCCITPFVYDVCSRYYSIHNNNLTDIITNLNDESSGHSSKTTTTSEALNDIIWNNEYQTWESKVKP